MSKEEITIDLTPTWQDVAHIYIDMLLDKRHSQDARDLAVKEIMKMARICDSHVRARET